MSDWIDMVHEQKRIGVPRVREAIDQALARGEVFCTPNGFANNGYTIVHRSTKRKPGVPYQLTWMDDAGPVGDTEPKTTHAAAERVWEDLTGEQKAHWSGMDVPGFWEWIDAKKKSGNPTLSPTQVAKLPVGSLVFPAVDGRPQGQALVVIQHEIVTPISVLPERADGEWPGGEPPEAFAREFFLIKEGRGRLPTHPTAQRVAQKWWDERIANPERMATRITWPRGAGRGAAAWLYHGRSRVGGVRSEEVLRFNECGRDEASLRARGFSPQRLFVVTSSEIFEGHRGRGHGKEMYQALFAALAKKYGLVFVAPHRCWFGSGTSPDARRVWDSLSKVYPSSGHVLAIEPRADNPRLPRMNPSQKRIATRVARGGR